MLWKSGRSKNGAGRAGLLLTDDGIAIARVLAAGAKPKLTHCSYQPRSDDDAFDRLVSCLPHARSNAVGVLSPGGYHLLLVEAPDVPEEELRAAVRWRIKDLIDFHIDDAVIDVFEMPAAARGGQGRPMYAVAARAELVKQQVETLEDAGFVLEAIDIPELCLRNVAALIEQDGEGIALLYLSAEYGILILARQGVMYLSRRIDTGVAALRAAGELRSELVAGLALEVRRSLDYFESHYEQNTLPTLYTSGLAPHDQAEVAAELSIGVQGLDLAAVLDAECELSDEIERLCLPAIGAALRREPIKL